MPTNGKRIRLLLVGFLCYTEGNRERKGVVEMSTLLSPQELHQNINDYIIIDCRGDLMNPKYGRQAYEKSHLPGAFYFDMNTDLAGPVKEHGGRHPLPDMTEFARKVAAIGIGNYSKVVVYDDWIFSAPRLRWMLRYMGVEQVYILAGGIGYWCDLGYEVTDATTSLPSESAPLLVTRKSAMAVDYEQVKVLTETRERVLVDVRGAARYRGEMEPMDRIAGHIPTAVNIPYEMPFSTTGFKSEAELRDIFKDLIQHDQTPVVYCGSGISAPVGMLAMEEIGLQPILYVGSYSDWSSYEENPIAVGEERL